MSAVINIFPRPFEFVNIESLSSSSLEWREGHFLENPKTTIIGPAAWIRVQKDSMYVFDGQVTRYSYGHEDAKDKKLLPEEYLLRYVAGTSNTEAIMAKRQLLMLNLDFPLHEKGLDWLKQATASFRFCQRPSDYVEHRHGENPFRTALVGAYYCK